MAAARGDWSSGKTTTANQVLMPSGAFGPDVFETKEAAVAAGREEAIR
jgi:hypothetical protein